MPVFVQGVLTGVPFGLTVVADHFINTQQGKEGESTRKLRLPRKGKVVAPDTE